MEFFSLRQASDQSITDFISQVSDKARDLDREVTETIHVAIQGMLPNNRAKLEIMDIRDIAQLRRIANKIEWEQSTSDDKEDTIVQLLSMGEQLRALENEVKRITSVAQAPDATATCCYCHGDSADDEEFEAWNDSATAHWGQVDTPGGQQYLPPSYADVRKYYKQ